MKNNPTPFTYLALGDSYTIGESVLEAERWPVVLAKSLTEKGISFHKPEIIAKTGWTTDELMEGIKGAKIETTYDLVSLLIGVNNQYRAYDVEIYKKEFRELLKMAIDFAGGESGKVFVVSIPDYGVTPFAASKNPPKIAQEIDLYNSINREISEALDVHWFDITPISRTAKEYPELIAKDQLHPSGKMYKAWVELISPKLVNHLQATSN